MSHGTWQDVFQNALLSIAAHCSRDNQSGCLEGTRGLGKLFVGAQKQNRVEDFEALAEQSPLSRRGWVFQERILSNDHPFH